MNVDVESYIIFSSLGERVLVGDNVSTTEYIDVSDLAAGMYYIYSVDASGQDLVKGFAVY